jgi:hypothetical protein
LFRETGLSHSVLLVSRQIGNKRLKVQHKQIRPGDNDRNSNLDDYVMGGFSQMPSSLPPSGPMAAMSNSAWYNNNSRAQVQHHAGGGGMRDVVDGSVQPLELPVPREDGSGTVVGNTVGSADEGDDTDPSRSPMPSPLSNLDPLRHALPDVSSSGD